MKTPQFIFYQGSTPTLLLGLPYALASDDVICATFSQGGRTVTEYRRNADPYSPAPGGSLTLDTEDATRLRISLTQADTFLFVPGSCELQLRTVKPNGSADTLFPVQGAVGKAQNEEVI